MFFQNKDFPNKDFQMFQRFKIKSLLSFLHQTMEVPMAHCTITGIAYPPTWLVLCAILRNSTPWHRLTTAPVRDGVNASIYRLI